LRLLMDQKRSKHLLTQESMSSSQARKELKFIILLLWNEKHLSLC
jgi:hypothetical protein